MIRPSVLTVRTRASCILVLALLTGSAAACATSGTGSAGDTTLPANVRPSAATFTSVHDDATVPVGPNASPTATSPDVTASPGVTADPQVATFCDAVQSAGRELAGTPTDATGPGAADDEQTLQRYRETFRHLAGLAPSSIKPEVTAMSATIDQVSSAADLDELGDPNFTAQQNAVADWVGKNCGFAANGG